MIRYCNAIVPIFLFVARCKRCVFITPQWWFSESMVPGKKPDCSPVTISNKFSNNIYIGTLNDCKWACQNSTQCDTILRYGINNKNVNWFCKAYNCGNLNNISWSNDLNETFGITDSHS